LLPPLAGKHVETTRDNDQGTDNRREVRKVFGMPFTGDRQHENIDLYRFHFEMTFFIHG
jgi:hypothetical protein